MSERLVEGLWDCKYCGSNAIGGLQKYCPNCGHPQDKGTKFYLGEKKRYLTDIESNEVGTSPDWACDYCTTLNNARFKYCKNCGASRDKETKDYFDLREEESNDCNENIVVVDDIEYEYETIASYPEKNDSNNSHKDSNDNETKDDDNFVSRFKSRLPFIGSMLLTIGIVAAIIAGIIWLFTPRTYEGVVSEKSWERNIVIEEYRTVKESAWDRVPTGGRLLYTDEEIRSYDKVFSHYETKTRQVSEQVFDGYETHVSYRDNGNGTFTESTSQTPKYKTVYKTETYEEPVYKDVPVYDTKYYYEIERWKYDRTEESCGVNSDPYWPEYTLDTNERIDTRSQDYDLTIFVENGDKDKTYTYQCSNEIEWNAYVQNQNVTITVTAGVVTEIE